MDHEIVRFSTIEPLILGLCRQNMMNQAYTKIQSMNRSSTCPNDDYHIVPIIILYPPTCTVPKLKNI